MWCTGLVAPRCVDLPGPGIKPVSPALAGRFFTTEPPGKLERDGGGGGRPKKKEKAEKKMKKQQKNIFVQRKVKKKKSPCGYVTLILLLTLTVPRGEPLQPPKRKVLPEHTQKFPFL